MGVSTGTDAGAPLPSRRLEAVLDFGEPTGGSPHVCSRQEVPRFSVLVPAYNSSATIGTTLRSVMEQTIRDWEAVVVDDGSSDDTAAIVERLCAEDPRIRLVRQPNGGTAAARNTARQHARGELHTLLDADDLFVPDTLAKHEAFVRAHPGFDIYTSNLEFLLRGGGRLLYRRGARFEREQVITSEEQIRNIDLTPTAATVFDPRVWELTGGYRHVYSEDYDFWLRALILGATYIYNPDVLYVYRRQEASKTTRLLAEAESFLQIQRDALELSGLTDPQRAALLDAITFSEARVGRRVLEERLLASELAGARGMYWRYRGAFPDPLKYWTGAVIMLVSPRLYARIKSSRMI
jgi:GT2 family glycosyltransferase